MQNGSVVEVVVLLDVVVLDVDVDVVELHVAGGAVVLDVDDDVLIVVAVDRVVVVDTSAAWNLCQPVPLARTRPVRRLQLGPSIRARSRTFDRVPQDDQRARRLVLRLLAVVAAFVTLQVPRCSAPSASRTIVSVGPRPSPRRGGVVFGSTNVPLAQRSRVRGVAGTAHSVNSAHAATKLVASRLHCTGGY